jgi:hypothetical protein
MTSPIKDSRPLKKFKVHRDKNGAVLVTSKVKFSNLAPGDHVLGFKSDEDIIAQHEDASSQHHVWSTMFNALEAVREKQTSDEHFMAECVRLIRFQFETFRDNWDIYAKVGDLPKRTRKEKAQDLQARAIFERCIKKLEKQARAKRKK